jgi:simple sugar transport system permease protein
MASLEEQGTSVNGERSATTARSSSWYEGAADQLRTQAPVVSIASILVAVVIGFSISTQYFFTSQNLLNVLAQSAPALIVAAGSTLVITAAGIDLSVGSLVAFTGATMGILLQHGLSPALVLLLALLIGATVGAANGFAIAYEKVPAFIVTLAALSILLGATQIETKGFSVEIDTSSWFINLGQGRIHGIPEPAIIAAAVLILAWVVLARSTYGTYIQGIGSNEEAVRRAGVRTRFVTLTIYAVSGLSAALGGLLVATRLQTGSSTAGTGLELQVIAAVVLGGTSLFGGRGSIAGSVFGVFTIALINNGLVLHDVSPFYVTIIQGSILLLAVWINTRVFSRWL